jgi:hypothetical protein
MPDTGQYVSGLGRLLVETQMPADWQYSELGRRLTKFVYCKYGYYPDIKVWFIACV